MPKYVMRVGYRLPLVEILTVAFYIAALFGAGYYVGRYYLLP